MASHAALGKPEPELAVSDGATTTVVVAAAAEAGPAVVVVELVPHVQLAFEGMLRLHLEAHAFLRAYNRRIAEHLVVLGPKVVYRIGPHRIGLKH